MDPETVLTECFGRLSDAQLGNLLYHADRETPVCCGHRFDQYTDGKGGG